MIRPATRHDAPALAELSAQLGYPTSTEQAASRLAAVLASPDHAVLVACLDEGPVVGWAHVFVAHRVESAAFAELGGLVVAEAQRGGGIGAALVAAAEKWAITRGVTRLRVRSRSGRVEAHGFYARRGYALTKQQHVFDKILQAGEIDT